jgi:hypothetical protein
MKYASKDIYKRYKLHEVHLTEKQTTKRILVLQNRILEDMKNVYYSECTAEYDRYTYQYETKKFPAVYFS